jgi:hypothetical protein
MTVLGRFGLVSRKLTLVAPKRSWSPLQKPVSVIAFSVEKRPIPGETCVMDESRSSAALEARVQP